MVVKRRGPRIPRVPRALRKAPRSRQPIRIIQLPAEVRRLGRFREQDNPIRKNVANALTMANLACGVLAIMVVSTAERISSGTILANASRVYLSCLLIVLAAILDRYDGKIARLLGIESEFGKQLDSLCDLISFGIAPAVISWQLHGAYLTGPWRPIGYLVAVLFPLAGAFRLARFNLTMDTTSFQGVPITLAGSLLILFSLLETNLMFRGTFGRGNLIAAGVITIVLAVLMASKVRIPKK